MTKRRIRVCRAKGGTARQYKLITEGEGRQELTHGAESDDVRVTDLERLESEVRLDRLFVERREGKPSEEGDEEAKPCKVKVSSVGVGQVEDG